MEQSIVLSKKNYKTEDEFWSAVAKTMNVLTENGYILTFRGEDFGNYVIDFSSGDRYLGENYPFWLTPEELDVILDYRNDKKNTTD